MAEGWGWEDLVVGIIDGEVGGTPSVSFLYTPGLL